MTRRTEQRENPRLALRYPIRVSIDGMEGASVSGRTVTCNVAARGAYFRTFDGDAYRVGQPVSVTLSVPHRLAAGGQEVMLDLAGTGRVVRIEGPREHRSFGEDGATLTGIALEFSDSLHFHYRWV